MLKAKNTEAAPMKKRLAGLVLLIVLSCLTVTGCAGLTSSLFTRFPEVPEAPEDSNLEFWIGDREAPEDISSLEVCASEFKGESITYYGSDYRSYINEYGFEFKPEVFVKYTFSGYPYYTSENRLVTGIEITDPEVKIYGFSVSTPANEVKSILESKGYKVLTPASSRSVSAEYGDLTLSFTQDYRLYVSVRVKQKSERVNNKYEKLPEPENELEFWVGDRVDGFDFSKHSQREGCFGCNVYFGLHYATERDENGKTVYPEYYVEYTVTNFPDYSSKHLHVSEIKITDPSVSVYGISISSDYKEAKAALEAQGFVVTLSKDSYDKKTITGLKASLGEYYVYFKKDSSYRIGFHVRNAKNLDF